MISLDGFTQELKERNLLGYWSIPNRNDEFRQPMPTFRPFIWKWRAIHDALWRASELIGRNEAHRRFIGFQHPDIPFGTSHTVLMGGQLVRPHEVAPAHRHTMEAIRFVVQGQGACTVVEGEKFPMEEGDLITTPNWTWHDHVNAGDAPIMWLDGANGPMVQYFQAGFGELYRAEKQLITKPTGLCERKYGAVRPEKPSLLASFRPPYRYRWEETEKTFEMLAEDSGDPFDGILLRYETPLGGGYTLPTMSCEIQMLRPGEKTRRHRHTHTVIYHAFRGSGATMVGDERLEWEQGDSFVVPLWMWHAHENTTRQAAILFSINDRPVMETLGLYREDND